MADLSWGGMAVLTGMGALVCWGANALSEKSFYGYACVLLALVLNCAGLAWVWPLGVKLVRALDKIPIP